MEIVRRWVDKARIILYLIPVVSESKDEAKVRTEALR